eukprot:Rmarinus@m.19793
MGPSMEKEQSPKLVPFRTVKYTVERPGLSLLISCCSFIGFVLLFILLSATVGVVRSDSGVPFYDRDDIVQKQQDAIDVGTDESTALSQFFLNFTMYERATEKVELAILYVLKDEDSSIFTADHLENIRKFEHETLKLISGVPLTLGEEGDDYSHYCAVTTPITMSNDNAVDGTCFLNDLTSCSFELADEATQSSFYCTRPLTLYQTFHPEFFDIYGETGIGKFRIVESSDVLDLTPDYSPDHIEATVRYWAEFGVLRQYTEANYTGVPYPDLEYEILVKNQFHDVTSSDFGLDPTVLSARGARSAYYFGLPRPGYASDAIREDEQLSEVGDWLYDELNSKLADADIPGIDVYWNDDEALMLERELQALLGQGLLLAGGSFSFVWLYLVLMTDSVFVASLGLAQIFLSFFPCLLLYRFIFGYEYFGTLNIISIFIIMGIGVDNFFVFLDAWSQYGNQPNVLIRLSQTLQRSGSAMAVTSLTTVIAFISNAFSAFPMISTFGVWSALLVACNFCAVVTYFPTVVVFHHFYLKQWFTYKNLPIIRHIRLCLTPKYKKGTKEADLEANLPPLEDSNAVVGVVCKPVNASGATACDEKPANRLENALETDAGVASVTPAATDVDEDPISEVLVEPDHVLGPVERYFESVHAPFIYRFRYIVVVGFIVFTVLCALKAAKIEADSEAPQIFRDDNNYHMYSDVLDDHFSRQDNPMLITVRLVTGINPDDPIDRSGTDVTDIDDQGKVNYALPTTYDATTPASQLYALDLCISAIGGSVPDLPEESVRCAERRVQGCTPETQGYLPEDISRETRYTPDIYDVLKCPMWAFKDWLEDPKRGWPSDNRQSWNFPCDEADDGCVFIEQVDNWLRDETLDPLSGLTNYATWVDYIYAKRCSKGDEFQDNNWDNKCEFEYPDGVVDEDSIDIRFSMSKVKLADTFDMAYTDGISLYEEWEDWRDAMVATCDGVNCLMRDTIQNSERWAYYFINKVLVAEVFFNTGLSLVLAFAVLNIATQNFIMAAIAALTISQVVLVVMAFSVVMEWRLGPIEAINFIMVIGLSVDYSVHLAEAYLHGGAQTRKDRTDGMLTRLGVSVVSGCVSSLGSSFFMFFAPLLFFPKFAGFIFCTLSFSLVYALSFMAAVLYCFGPEGTQGSWRLLLGKWVRLGGARTKTNPTDLTDPAGPE